MSHVMTKNEFMTRYINDMYDKKYKERQKERDVTNYKVERSLKTMKAIEDRKER